MFPHYGFRDFRMNLPNFDLNTRKRNNNRESNFKSEATYFIYFLIGFFKNLIIIFSKVFYITPAKKFSRKSKTVIVPIGKEGIGKLYLYGKVHFKFFLNCLD